MKPNKLLSYSFGIIFFLIQFYPAIIRYLFHQEVSEVSNDSLLLTLISLGCCFLMVYFSSGSKKTKRIVCGIIIVGALIILVQELWFFS